ncbi:MAG: OmpA family protein [Cytophagaceae bacterium]|nr:OmpA family protein [Cytophagaceae bacterium]
MDTIMYDEFRDNGLRWTIKDDEKHYLQIHNGYYECGFTGRSWYVTWDDYPQLNYSKDFSYEASLTSVDGGEMGLIWAANDLYKAYYFTTKNGMAYFYTYNADSNYVPLDSGAFTKATTQLLKVDKVGAKVNFYVNGKKVFSESVTKFHGDYFGFAMIAKSRFKIDYVYLKQKRNINVNPLAKPAILENLGNKVNTPYNEYIPVITPDGKGLYFISDGNPANTGGADYQDIYYSEFSKGEWSKAKNIGTPLNNSGHNGVFSVTPDGNTLLLENKYSSDGKMYAGVSISHRTRNSWTFPEAQVFTDFRYGDYGYADYALSANGKVLILAVQEEGNGYGERDLHVSFFTSGNTWTKPINLGTVLNTRGDEQAPFLASDGVTMYFSSSGHPGFGEADVFMTKRLDNTWKNWSKPVNMGRPINGRGYDGFYSTSASGEYAYISSYRELNHGSDIYRIKTPPETKPEPVILIHGKVLSVVDNSPVFSKITYENLETHKEIGVARTDQNHAEYKLVLPYGEHIGVRAEADGYIPVWESFDVRVKKDYIEIEKNLYMMPISLGKKVNLNNVFFVQSKPELLETSYSELDHLKDILKKNPRIEITLHGHTDNQGNPADNLKLSQQRADAVKAYLVKGGIEAKRIKGVGHGGTQPSAPNDTDENRKKNRRVEIEVTKF